MSVIIRLQGLPWSASAMNIRHFFAGLNIPAGGVHIIGGEGGDAFIAFSSDDDARMAMKKNNCPLNGTTVQLFLSSKAEMQSVIDAARAGSSTSTAATTPANATPSQQQTPTPQQRQPFSSTSTAFPVDGQTPSSANAAFPGQQMNDFNTQMPPGQFARGDWQGFQSYGGRMDDQSQQMPNQFMYNQRMPGNQADGRFPSGQGGPGGMDRAPYGGQFHDPSSMLPQTGPAAMGMGGMYPDMDPMTQKPSGFGEQVGGRAGNGPAGAFDNGSLLGNMGAMGRGQSSFPGQLGIGPNRNAFNAGMGKPTPGIDMPGGLLGNRMSLGDDPLGRANSMDDKSVGDPMDSVVGPSDKFTNPAVGGPDGRKADLMGWGDGQSDARFPGGYQKFEPDIHTDKPMGNRENMLGPDGRPFQQFPFRGDSDRGRMNRGLDGADPLIDPSRLMDRQDREPSFPGRDVRTGSRFSAPDPEGRFADRSTDRFSSERMQSDDMPSTKYPPDSETPAGLGDRPHGQFPPVRGRYDDVRYPGDDRKFPPEERFPNEDRRSNRDQAYPPDSERFPEGDRKFPPGRGFPPDERRHMMDERRFPPGPGGRRFPPDEGRYPPEDRMGMNPERMRPDDFPGRRPVDNSFDEGQFRDRDEEPRPRDAFGRGRRGMDDRFPHEGRPDHRPGFRDFEDGEEPRRFPPSHRFPPERPFRGEEGKEDFRAPPVAPGERRARVSRWDREQQLDDWQGEGDAYPRPAGARPPIADKADFPGVGQSDDAELDEPMDMDQRGGRDHIPGRGPLEGRRPPLLEGRGGARPHLDVDGRRGGPGMEGYRAPLLEGRGHPGESMRGRGIEGMRGRGMDGMRGRGFEGRGGPGIEGRRGPGGIPSLMEENSFDYGHGSVTRGRPPPMNTEEDEDFNESLDYDSRFPGPAGRGGLFERPPRGRGEPFFNRGRPGPPFGRGRGMDMDRRFEESAPEGRMSMDVDARNVGGRPDGPPLRPVFGGDKVPDFSVKPGSGKGLLGDAPVLDRPALAKPELEKKDVTTDAFKRDLDNRAARRSDDRDRDNRSSDRRGRERDDRRSPDRDRSRYKYERDRSERRRSRSRERGGRDNDGRRSRERSTSTKQDGEIPKQDTQAKSEPKKRCIQLRNLPPTAAYKDVRKFLQPIDISFDSLKMINDKQGKPTGEAYVQFRHHEDAARAFRRHGERLYGKVISISLCTDEEFAAAALPESANKKDAPAAASADNQKSEKADKIRYITQLKDLPLNITKQDIVQFFRGVTIDNNGEAVYIEYDQSGVATGNGFVEFKGDFDYKKALTKDGSLLGTVAVRVFPGKPEEADDLKRKQLEMLQRAALRNATGPRMMQPGLQGQPPRLQGQPPRLQGQPPRMQGQPPPRPQGQAPGSQGQPRPQGQQPRPQGQPPGPQGQQSRPQGQPPGPPGQQLRPQGQQPRPQGQPRPPLMGQRPGMGPQQPSPATPAGQGSQNRASTPSDNTETVCVHIQGLPLLATPQDIREFFSDCQIAMRGINIAHDSRGKPLGEGFVEFKFKSDFEKAIKKDKTSLGRHIVAVKPIGKKEMMERLENARGVAAAQQSNQGQTADDQHKPQNQNQSTVQSGEKQQAPQNPQQGPPAGQNPPGAKPNTPAATPNSSAPTQGATTVGPGASKSIPPGVLNKNWYYVRCQNFPPDISISEILTFFQGFRPIGESIRLHYSSDGKPTGNAVVGFGSSEEAQKALRQLTMKVCRQNIVTLHPA